MQRICKSVTFTFIHLADASIQSNIQLRNTTKKIMHLQKKCKRERHCPYTGLSESKPFNTFGFL